MDEQQQQTPVSNEPVSAERQLGPAFPMPMVVAFAVCLALLAGTLWYGVSSMSAPVAEDIRKTQTAAAAGVFEAVPLTAKAVIVYDAKEQAVLFEKNAQTQLPLASLTKAMLALVAVETLLDDALIPITPEALAAEGDTGFGPGEEWALQNLIDATLIPSSNDGAYALAIASGNGSVPRTVSLMNKRARELGLSNTYFLNPTGLDESASMAGAYGSAHDIALLLSYLALTEPAVLDGTTRDGMLLTSENGIEHTAVNTNEALGQIPGLIGGKTGYTDLAGGNLAVVFDAGLGHPIVVVVLGSTQEGRFEDVRMLVRATRETLR